MLLGKFSVIGLCVFSPKPQYPKNPVVNTKLTTTDIPVKK